MSETFALEQCGNAIGQNIQGCYYDNQYWPYQPVIYNPPQQIVYTYYYPQIIDYDLLAEKIVEKLKGEKKKSVEDVRKELNRLLDELKDKK